MRNYLNRDVGGYSFSIETRGRMRSAFLVRDNIRHRRNIEDAYLQEIEQAQFEIIVANAYFFPGLNFRHALLDAAGRGVRVLLLLQGKMDHPLLQYASHALYGGFLDAGIEIHEYRRSMMHAKVAVIDEHWATVGSSNLDPFSLLLSLEANVVVDDESFAKELKHSLNRAIDRESGDEYREKMENEVDSPAPGKLAELRLGAIHDRNRGVCPRKKPSPLKPIEKAA